MEEVIMDKSIKAGRMAFLLSSCDTYKDTWQIFFDMLEKYWHDIPYPIYLNTEQNSFPEKIRGNGKNAYKNSFCWYRCLSYV